MTELEIKILNMMKDLLESMPKDHEGPAPEVAPEVGAKLENLLKEIISSFELQMKTSTASPDFIKAKELDFFVDMPMLNYQISIWIGIQRYKYSPNPEFFNQTEQMFKDMFDDTRIQELEADSHASFVLPVRQAISDLDILKAVAKSGNKELIGLFKKYLSSSVVLKEDEKKSVSSFNFFDKSTLSQVEKVATKMQRNFRGKRRRKQELDRINEVYVEYAHSSGRSVKDLIKDANTPYVPQQCEKELSERIVRIANEIKLFSEIRHVTDPNAIKSIVDDGLYGRETLQKFTMAFKSAALESSDIENGDANVICFGPFDIDTRYLEVQEREYLEIFLDANKIQKDNPCIFFKQRDFQFDKKEARTVVLGDDKLSFTHESSEKNINFQFITGEEKSNASIPRFMLIAYDFAKIHQILILNFFRILDKIDSPAVRRGIYAKLASQDDKQLESFLRNTGMAFSDTSEFNFYGAHKIDLSSLLKIRFKDFELNIPRFIASLNKGELKELKEAREKIPALFTSYRFLDHLLDNVSHKAAHTELLEIRKQFQAPYEEKHEQKEGKEAYRAAPKT